MNNNKSTRTKLYIMSRFSKLIEKYFDRLYKDQSGQMLLMVFIILMLLLIILFAIIVNLRVDIKETQVEREYEKSYSIAEEELFKISSDGFDIWDDDTVSEIESPVDQYASLCPTDPPYDCYYKCGMGDDPEACVMVKRLLQRYIDEMTIQKDETLEVDLGGYIGDIHVGWIGADAISLIVVYLDGGEYQNKRRAVCRRGNDNCYQGFENYSNVFSGLGEYLDIENDLGIPPGGSGVLMRIRAIGASAEGVTVTTPSPNALPEQMEVLRVQGFSKGLDIAEGLPGPEVYTKQMINKRLPALFDYVLFVAGGDVSK